MAGKTKDQLAEISKGTQFTSERQPSNPGRKKKLPELDALLAELLGSGDGTVEGSEAKAVFAALVKEAKGGNVPAAVAVLNRAYGMPKQSMDIGGQKNNPVRFSNVSDKALDEALKILDEDGE